jgi:hypothetical protein
MLVAFPGAINNRRLEISMRKLVPALCGAVALGVAIGCGSESVLTTPTATRTSASITSQSQTGAGGADETDTVFALTRKSPLDHDVTAIATIGPAGGSISIDAAGATIVFPAGALDSPRQIKMTAKAGATVAYEFCPHGITFAVPVAVQQDLTFTRASANDLRMLQAGYYKQSLGAIFVDPGNSLVTVSELRGIDLDKPINPRFGTFYISHFSGYIISTGFAGGGGESDSASSLP